MKNIIFLILDEFADWETAFLPSALNDKNITPSYSIKFASIDMEIKTSMGNLKVLPNLILDKINENTTDGLILIGGKSWRNQSFKTECTIIELVKKFKDNNKVVGAICDAAYFLAINSLLNDCRHTVNNFDEIKDNQNYKNSESFINTNSVLDRKIITAKGDSPLHFAADVMRALGDIPEKNIDFFFNIYTIGFTEAMKKYSSK